MKKSENTVQAEQSKVEVETSAHTGLYPPYLKAEMESELLLEVL